MIVTKRGLLKVIVILALIDAVACFWYFTLRLESRGESPDLWHTDTVTEVADTIADATLPDSFHIVQMHSYFMSQQPVLISKKNTHLASIKRVKVRQPDNINGNYDLQVLYEAINEKAFGQNTRDLGTAMAAFLEYPKFSTENSHLPYIKVDTITKTSVDYTTVHKVLVYPLLTSHRLMVFEIDFRTKIGKNATETSAYIHYDRVTHHVLTRADIINTTKDNIILALINSKIATLNKKKKLNLHNASKVPNELHVMRTGVAFVYAPGEIAPLTEGEIEILIPHDALRSSLNQSFLPVLDNSDGWWNYKKLKW